MSIRELQSVPLHEEVQQDHHVPEWWSRVEQLRDYTLEADASDFFGKVSLADVQEQLESRYQRMRDDLDEDPQQVRASAQEWISDAEALISEAVRRHKAGSTTPQDEESDPELEYEPPEPQAPQFASSLELSADWRWPWKAAGRKGKADRKKSDGAASSVTVRRVATAGAVIASGVFIGRQFFGG